MKREVQHCGRAKLGPVGEREGKGRGEIKFVKRIKFVSRSIVFFGN